MLQPIIEPHWLQYLSIFCQLWRGGGVGDVRGKMVLFCEFPNTIALRVNVELALTCCARDLHFAEFALGAILHVQTIRLVVSEVAFAKYKLLRDKTCHIFEPGIDVAWELPLQSISVLLMESRMESTLPQTAQTLTSDKSTVCLVQLGVCLLEKGNPELVAVTGKCEDGLGLLCVAGVDRDLGIHDNVDPFSILLETAYHDAILLVFLKAPEHGVEEIVARGEDGDCTKEPFGVGAGSREGHGMRGTRAKQAPLHTKNEPAVTQLALAYVIRAT